MTRGALLTLVALLVPFAVSYRSAGAQSSPRGEGLKTPFTIDSLLAAYDQGSMAQSSPPAAEGEVRTTILPGSPPAQPRPAPPVEVLPTGDISLNFPAADVQAVATAVLGDTLKTPFTIDPNLHGQVTLVTPHPIRRADVIPVLEQALTRSGLVLVRRLGSYSIMPSGAARATAPTVGPDDPGFGNEALDLKFVNAEQMRRLLDPLVPGGVASVDTVRNVLVISGNSTQREALRQLVAEFDVDWLKGMSFALFVPQRTDARLIAPELEKLLNGPGAPTAGLVRLIAMDQLNGILAITSQPQYLEDTRRFVEILDREGEGAEKRVFVYRVQNSRASDLAKVLNGAFGTGASGGGSTETEAPQLDDRSAPSPTTAPPTFGAGAGYGAAGASGGVVGGGLFGSAGAGAGAAGARTGAAGGEARGDRTSASGSDSRNAGAQPVSITADEANNAIVVYATPRNYALVEDALAKLDVPPLQVMIDASIAEVTLNHTLQYGLQWSFQAGLLNGALSQGSNQTISTTTTSATGATTTGATTTIPPGPQQNFPGLSFLYSGHGVAATLNALSTVTDVNVLSAPKLMVLNNHTAIIEVGNQVPIQTGSSQSTLTTGAPIVNSIEYRDTGIILKVTPRVNSGGLVLLDIAQEVSDVATANSSTIASPTIEQRKISTSVAVQDGETVALGGLMKNEVDKGRSTVPLFGNIPVLGHLFGDTTGALVRTELLVLLTPRVVRTPVDARAVTAELKAKIHLGAPPPPKSKARADPKAQN
jgi:general secretion pathway protein D